MVICRQRGNRYPPRLFGKRRRARMSLRRLVRIRIGRGKGGDDTRDDDDGDEFERGILFHVIGSYFTR
jgi:hypothetical protein